MKRGTDDQPPAPLGAAESAPALKDYREKRNPLTTPEPFGAEHGRSAGPTRAGRFVVHLHRARQRHYDVRLQIGRTLKSFAVPRGPSLDPNEKRLAVLTEDHPLEYADFEDVIPSGNYGAGPMIAWDIGRVTYLETDAEQGVQAGKLDFLLFGHKLKGRFALVRTKRGAGNEWLLLKKKDAHSREEGDILTESPESVLSGLNVDELEQRQEIAEGIAHKARAAGAIERQLPATFEPMLCALDGANLDDPERLYELKLDGVRIVARRSGRQVTLSYRHGRLCTHSYPEIARALATLPGDDFVLDGEIVAFDENGRPRFQRLGPRIQARGALDVARVVTQTPVVYLIFDLLALGGLDFTGLPLITRKGLLRELVRGKGLLRTLDHLEGRGAELFAWCESSGLEGVVAKKKNSPYRLGPRRSPDWVKLKCAQDDDFVIVGYLPGKRSRAKLGSLGVASFQEGKLIYRGGVGSGLDARDLSTLHETLSQSRTDTPSVELPLPEEAKGLVFVRPELVVSVQHQGYSDDGRLRAPVFRGLRPELRPEACIAGPHDEPSGPLSVDVDVAADDADTDTNAAVVVGPTRSGPQLRPELKLSNRNKVFFPEQGYTKGDMLDYYASVAEVMLPFLHERPVVLVRYPDGIHGKNFYQWNVPQGTPSWVRTLSLRDPDEPEREKHVFLIDSVDALLYVINLGCIPLHVLACRAENVAFADFLTFDFDLGGQPFARAIELALKLREILADLGLSGFPKTSGQGGLHVLVPLGPGVPSAGAKLLVELLGRLLISDASSFATMERRIDKRGDRLYVDTGQTGQWRTIVAPYSVRAQPIAGVSTPLFWNELSGALDPERFTLMTVPARVAELGDPLSTLLDARPDIGSALGKLERWVKGE